MILDALLITCEPAQRNDMSYNLDWAVGTTKATIKVAAGDKDTSSTSLSLYGKGSPNYGEGIQENLIRMLENWASPAPPPHPTQGQLWYNTANNTLNIFNGSSFDDTQAVVAGALSDYQKQAIDNIVQVDARVDNILSTVTANSAAIVKETQDRILAINTEALARTAAIIAEAQARNDAIASGLLSEAQSRAVAISAEATARQKAISDGLLAESLARQAAITSEQTSRQTAVDSLSQQITTLTASVGDNAAALQTEQTVRASAVDTLTQQVTTVAARMDSAESSIVDERTTRVSAIAALAQSISDLTASTNSNLAAIQAEQQARTDGDTATASQITGLLATTDSLNAAIQAEQTARTDADSALSTTLTALTTSVNNNSTLISQEQTARSDAISALTEQVNSVYANTQTNAAAIQTEQQTRTDSISALSSRIDTLVAGTAGDATAAIDAETTARTNADSALGSRIDSVTAVANAKNKTYSQSTAPTSPTVGDLWIDTSNSNQLKRWNGSAWVASDDTRIAQNQAAILAEQTARANADSAQVSTLTSLTAVTNAKNQCFKQSTAPTAVSIGDLWIDTGNGNLIKRWDGTSWVASDDTRIGQAMTLGSQNQAAITAEQTARANGDSANASSISSVSAIANAKNTTYSQTTAPTAAATGDLWIDTGNGNLIKRWNGTAWVAVDDTRLAANAAAITSEQTARATADTALGSRIDSVVASNQANSTSITTEQTARISADNALGSRIDSVVATASSNTALITTETQARTDADTALGVRIDAVVSTSNSNTAAITAEQKARSDGDAANASSISSVSAVANSKNRTFSQSTAPTALATGDLWIDTGNGNIIKRWNGTAWVASDDTRLAANAAAITAEQTARANGDSANASQISSVSAVANSKNLTFSQNTTPTASATGDLWIDTGNNNQLKRWNGTSWSAVDDARIASALASITAEQNARAAGDSANASSITNLTATVNVKNTTFKQSTTPTANAIGDTWIDTGNGNLLKYWSGTAWVASDDARLASTYTLATQNAAAITAEQTARANADSANASQINSVSAIASSKNVTFSQSTAPTAFAIGDLWIDTGNGNLIKRWNGTAWVASDDTRLAANAAAISTEQTARANADSALSARIDTVTASANTNAAAITAEQTARANADSANATQISNVSAVANSKNTTFSQSTAPTASAVGDLWIDTSNGNLIKRWNGTAWIASDDTRLAANAAAITAEQTARANADSANASQISSVSAVANSKNATFSQSTTPTATAVGDLWIDTGNGNLIKRWNGTTWVAQDDTRLAANAAAITAEQTARANADSANATQISNVSAVANAKNTTFSQSTAPTATAVGDLWIDTSNGNLIKRWNGSAWVAVDDTRLAANAAAITAEQTARANADSANATQINNVSAVANSKIVTFSQTATPTGMAVGDLWLDAGNGNLLKRWSGSGWTPVDDARIAQAITQGNTNAANITAEQTTRANADSANATQINNVSAVATSKNKTFFQSTAPTATAVGDLWIDTGNGNLIKRWDGSTWAQVDDARFGTLSAAITTEQNARVSGDTAISQRLDTVAAAADFDTALLWGFDDGTGQGWSQSGITISVDSVGSSLTLTSANNDPQFISPSFTVNGSMYPLIRARIRRVSGTGWDGTAYYSTAGHSWSLNYRKDKSDPGLGLLSNWTTLEWDMSALTAGGTDWQSNNITKIRLDFGAATGDTFQVDWVGIGRSGPGASKAEITTEQNARISGDQSLASQISTLTSTVNGNTASIQTTQSTVNGLSAQYSVKIDNNGYVTGYGLASTPVNGVPTSIFNIVADKFALTKPTLNNGVPVVPFSVDTTTTPATIVLDGSIQLKNTNISNGAVTPNKMAVTSLSAISSNIGTITSGTLSSGTIFAGSLSAATGTFSGSLNAATGTFAGALSAATGTFSGDISAANGTFSGTLRANIVDTSQLIQGSVSNVDFYSYNNYANTTQNISVTPTLSVPADSLVMFFSQETHSGQANLSAVTGYWTVQGLASTSNLVTVNAAGGSAGRYLTAGTYNLKGVLSCAGGQGYLELSAVKIKR